MNKIKSFTHQHKTPLKFLNSTLVLYAITLLTSVITYRYIGPEYLGIWATFTTFSTLATFLRMGIVNGMNRELPYYLGKNEPEKAIVYAETTLAYTVFTIIVLLIAGVFLLCFYDFDKYDSLSQSYWFAALVFVVKLVIEPYSSYLTGTFRTNDSFVKLSNIQYINALLRLITLIMVVFWGYEGFLIREIIMILIGVILLHIYRPLPKVHAKFNWHCFVDLFKIGFNVFLASYLATFVDTFPRLYIIDKGTPVELGLFSPVLVVLGIVYLIPNTISNYLYPKFSFAYGNGEKPIYFWNKIKQLLLLSLALGVVFAIGIYLTTDYVIPFFPKYTDSAPYIKLMSLGVLFLGYKVCNLLFVIFKLYIWMWISPIVYAIILASSLFILNVIYDDKLIVASVSLIITNFVMFIYYVLSTYYVTHKQTIVKTPNTVE